MRQHSNRRRGEIIFARLNFKSIPYELDEERDFLLVLRAFAPDVVSIATTTVTVNSNASSRSTVIPGYTIVYGDGDTTLAIVGRVKQLQRFSERNKVDFAEVVEDVATSTGRIGLNFDIVERRNLSGDLVRAATQIELHGAHAIDPELSRAGYEALFVHRPDNIAGLKAALPVEADAAAIAMRLAWLGELTFEATTPVEDINARFAHTPVHAVVPHMADAACPKGAR